MAALTAGTGKSVCVIHYLNSTILFIIFTDRLHISSTLCKLKILPKSSLTNDVDLLSPLIRDLQA